MDSNSKFKGIPTDLIIASFKGALAQDERDSLNAWLSVEGNKERYEALHRLWEHTVSNAEDFSSSKGYGRFRRMISNVWKRVAIAASVAAVAVTVAVTLSTMYSTPATSDISRQICTCMTGKSAVELPDGSKVVLHQGASLSYDNAFSKTNRTVELKGEAYFDVAKDAENEFVVSSAGVDIIVHGTSFNVSESEEAVTVSLVDGSVEIVTGNDVRCSLTPGYSAIYNKVSGSLTSAKDDVDFASCWASESLTFTQTSLGEVCRYLSKWYGVEIVVPEHLKTSCSYTFTIREEPIDQILEIMSRLNPMKYLYTNDHRIIISEIN